MERVKLIVLSGTAYVWNAEGLMLICREFSAAYWAAIRKLRILGNFIGGLADLPRQNQLAGLPLALLKEETTLLLEKGHGVTKLISNLSNPPSEDIRKKSKECLDKLFLEQAELMKAKRKQEIESKIDVILKGKKAKRSPEEAKTLNKETVLEEELQKLEAVKMSAIATQICTDDPWLEDRNYEDYTWDYPKSETENLHYSVFKDLWERGYYITPGGKFGGDYLAYPGDPVKFHAFFIVICVEKGKKITMNEIITYGRLGNSVRKTVAFAYLDENRTVGYQSIKWSGF